MYEFDWSLPFRAPYVGWVGHGLLVTLELTVLSTGLSLLLGALLALGRLGRRRLLSAPCTAFVETFRNVPTLFWLLFFYFVAPELTPPAVRSALNQWSGLPFAAALAGLTLANAAHVAEIFRAALRALPRAQSAAGLSLGLAPFTVWWSVLLPQAFRTSLPALGARTVHNCHNTALAMVLSVPEITWQTRQIETTTFRGFEAVTIATLMFVLLSLGLALLVRGLEHRWRRWAA